MALRVRPRAPHGTPFRTRSTQKDEYLEVYVEDTRSSESFSHCNS